MMTKNADKKREQMLMFCMDDMVPQNHMLRLIDKAIDWTFIYDLVEDKYCMDNGRPSMDPVMLIKIPFIQYLYGIKSMRQTIKEIEVNVAYRWFLGLDMMDQVPHFSTFGKNYTRRFKDTDLFEQIFSKILEDCMKFHLVDTEQIFVDATHVKACANSKKMRKRIARDQALWYEEELKKEIAKDREAHGKKPLKDKDNNQPPSSGGGIGKDNTFEKGEIPEGAKTQKCSTSDPESGWFRKGEHKHVFAYAVETACDKHGWILGYTVHPGNEHDSQTFKPLYDKIKKYTPDMIVADAGYRTPAIAHELIEDGIDPLFPYKRPMTKDGFFRKYEYVYDEYYDCYICPENHILNYNTTNRDGYKEYKSCGQCCASCPSLKKCTESKDHVKVVTRHVWEEYMEMSEDIRHTPGNKQIYDLRKETIERIFGTAKEQHGFRYTQYAGKARMEMKAGLTFACMNLKKLAKMVVKSGRNRSHHLEINQFIMQFTEFKREIEKWCWSLTPAPTLSTV
jgi:transposase